ncbi:MULTISPECIES: MFS transporter [unclassified Streptomyces]|uniref:MFS transporter n=1 Tax=unclassified Streptomyces TaxID=2593676 RepID=UPI0019070630|nr:MFS transporter [Streptomyces sp. HSG2]
MLEAAGDTPARTAAPARTPPPTWLVVTLACAGQFLVILDVSVVNVALPSMRAALGLSSHGLQWVVSAYAIAFSGFMLLGGRAGDLYGRKRMFLVGLGLFTLASLAGGLAQEGWQLLAARAAQGLGAAVLAPSTLTLLTAAVPGGPARARAIGTWTAVGAGGGATGGLIGGSLVQGLSWRWVLLINVPVGVVVLVAAGVWLAESRAEARRRLDLPGAVTATAGLATLAYGISRTATDGWTSPATVAALLAGPALICLFLLVEARTAEPLMPLRLLRARAVGSANAAMLVCGSAMFCMWFFMTLYVQNVLGYSPLQAGLALMPSSLAVVCGSKLAPRLLRLLTERDVAALGALVATTGFAWQSTMRVDTSYLTGIMLPGVLMMLGAGLASTPLAAVATAAVGRADAGLASGLVNTSRTMGGALGLATLSTIAATRSGASAAPEALTEGYALVFRTSAGVLAVGALMIWVWLPAGRRRSAMATAA